MITIENRTRNVYHFPVMGEDGHEAWRLVLGDSNDSTLYVTDAEGKRVALPNEYEVPETVGTPDEPRWTKTMLLQPAPVVRLSPERFRQAFPEGSLNEKILSGLVDERQVRIQ